MNAIKHGRSHVISGTPFMITLARTRSLTFAVTERRRCCRSSVSKCLHVVAQPVETRHRPHRPHRATARAGGCLVWPPSQSAGSASPQPLAAWPRVTPACLTRCVWMASWLAASSYTTSRGWCKADRGTVGKARAQRRNKGCRRQRLHNFICRISFAHSAIFARTNCSN